MSALRQTLRLTPSRDKRQSLAALAWMQRRHRTRRCGRRLPAGDGPDAGPRLRVVGDPREPPPQLDDGRQLALLVESGTDRGGIGLGDDEHGASMEHAHRGQQARRWSLRGQARPRAPDSVRRSWSMGAGAARRCRPCHGSRAARAESGPSRAATSRASPRGSSAACWRGWIVPIVKSRRQPACRSVWHCPATLP